MSEQTKLSSGRPMPTLQEIAVNIKDYEFRLNQLIILPNIEVWKDGKMVRVITEMQQHKFSGTINPEYADQLLADILTDFKLPFQEAVLKAQDNANQTKGE